jgi:phosphoglycolate phosphatase-like HAD superfamily hydrolase
VPPPERIAVFDNDGKLWCELPFYFQALFAIDRIKALAPQHPQWKDKRPYKAILDGDLKAVLSASEKDLLEALTIAHSGMTTDEFEKIVSVWFRSARHPRFNRPYVELVYQPMIELLNYLRANGFKTFIVSGGGIEFMRVFAEKACGIPPEQVVGSYGAATSGNAASRLYVRPFQSSEVAGGGRPRGGEDRARSAPAAAGPGIRGRAAAANEKKQLRRRTLRRSPARRYRIARCRNSSG